ncbi:TolC family protein [Mucilaginibacter auburnensis]|uniref:Outer membrane efflux protein n=1 Tax=Mucilaginibacter auburnensis TaxID=1457233 RepID=A0A2H9VL55_9SPHI|nr:TolC family protein [Mucilaginibacter auburnensis]PJJ79068.1 outer membrane efflux protein [Mucilaginibacter auburnensis]
MTLRKKIILPLILIIFLYSKVGAQTISTQATILPELSKADNLQRLVDTAIKNYPRVRYFQNRVSVASANVSKVKASWLDALTLSYVYQPSDPTINPVNPTSTYFKGLQAGVFLNVGTLVAKPWAVKQAKREVLVQQTEQEEYIITLSAEVRRRYYMYIQRVGELKLQIRAAEDTEAQLKDVKYKFEKGEETFDSYSKVLIQFTEHQQTKVQAEANVFIAKADVEELIGTNLENVIK